MARPAISPEKRAEMRGHVREALVRLARKRGLKATDTAGWSAITIRDVIAEADISIGTFYKYFKNRSDLAQTLWVEPVNALKATIQADVAAADSPTAQVRSILENYVAFAFEQNRLFKAAFLIVRPEENEKPDPVALADEPFYANLKSAFEAGQETGEFTDFDPHTMAQIFWSAIHGSLALPINLDRFTFDPPEELTRSMIDALMALVAGGGKT